MIEISEGKLIAVLAPDLGGAVMSLGFEGKPVLRPAPSREAVAADPRETACYPCVPWFSRLFGGLDFGGVHYDLAPTLPECDPEHALHGHGWVNPWAVTEQSKDNLICEFTHEPETGLFPFPFIATQKFVVSDKQFNILLTVKNSGDAPMPAGLGLHPFFPAKKNSSLNLTEHLGQPKQASILKPPEKIEHSGPFPDDPVDYTIKRWDGSADIIHDDLCVSLKSNARSLHLYSPEDADFFCAEPVTHYPGHFGEDVLAPGETMNLFLTLDIEKAG